MEQQAKPVAPLASERLALIGQAAGAKIDLDRLVAAVQDASGSVPAEIIAQQGELAALIRDIATASPTDLPALKRAVATAVAVAASTAQQAQAASSGKDEPTLADLADASRHAVQSALDYTRALDLQFTSADDERAYRAHERERSAYIASQQAKGTPEGDLNAAGGAVGQMADAKAHGAGGVEFDQHVVELLETTTKLREAIRRSGQSTEAFDNRLRDDLRRIMLAKGMSDAEIDAKFAANSDPLAAARAYLTDKDVDKINATIKDAGRMGADVVAVQEPPPETKTDVASAMAELRAAGVSVTSPAPETAPVHGLTATATAAAKGRGTV